MKPKKKFIPGIYNYCDRWCERCDFTTRCRNFETTGERSSEENDPGNEAFVKTISDDLDKAIQLLHKSAAEYGIDLEAIPKEEMEEYDRLERMTRKAMKKHLVSQLTLDYIKEAKTVFNDNSMLNEKENELLHRVEIGIGKEHEILQEAITIKDCIEVISWYLYFIHVKFQRALHGLLGNDNWQEENGFQRDCDGSAKIALIAAERSLESWIIISENFPGSENEIIPILGRLQQIIRVGKETFPKAEEFMRPGFDK